MSGRELFQAARRLRQLAAVPKILIVTAYGDEIAQKLCGEEGLDGYLTKPVSPATLFDAIMNFFGQKGPPPMVQRSPRGPHPQKNAGQLLGVQVLLVEDNDFNQEVASELLALMGVEVTVVGNGQEALEKLRLRTFDAVLMDLQMPVMDGYEATRQLRADPTFAGLPILAMTAHAMTQERERCNALGMNDYITKPIDPDELASTLAKWVRPAERQETPPAILESPPNSPRVLELAGISWEEGKAHFGGMTALYENLLGRFLEKETKVARGIRNALAEGEPGSAERLAHSMISAAGFIGAKDLAATAKALQDAIHNGPGKSVPSLVAQFEADLAKVLGGLKTYFGPTRSKE
jgi:CheY-like chemotaxis protein/HPt (histidine-containing phosphotransfer) domain-containing protein